MRDINELIGIIKGINFDRIINEKEVSCLQLWVDKNRNLAYEPIHAELIDLVDRVLEDKIITDDEYEELLQFCDGQLENGTNEFAKICELNGIIEAIICDDEVNEEEVYRLKDWLDQHGDGIQGHKSIGVLRDIIDDILADGIVSEMEQEQLKRFLKGQIDNSRFEAKLTYLKNQVKLKRNIGVDLIDLLANEDTLQTIHERAEEELRKVLNSYPANYEMIFISLVLIAMIDYDGNYYTNVQSVYEGLYDKYSAQRIEGLIRTILNQYCPKDIADISKTRMINVALANAIVPRKYLGSFFAFIFDIYQLNFEYSLPEDLYEEFRFVYDGLYSDMSENNDDLQINVTKKSYKLIRSTKRLIVDRKGLEAVIQLSIIIVKLIDKKMWGKENYILNPYLKQGYAGWVQTLPKDDRELPKDKNKPVFRSRWEPQYKLLQNDIYLIPPIHRIKNKYHYRDIVVKIQNEDQVIYTNNEMDIREIIGGYQVSIGKIKLENPLGKIQYQILAGDEVIYDSKEKLYRSFIVFDQQGEEISNHTDFSGTAIVCMPKENEVFTAYHQSGNYILTSRTVGMGEAFSIGDTVFHFSSLVKPGVIGEVWENHFLQPVDSTKTLKVYQKVDCLVFEIDHPFSRCEMIIDGQMQKLDEFEYSITQHLGRNKFMVKMDSIANGIHSIEVNTYEKNNQNRKRILLVKFAIDGELDVETIKIDEKTYMSLVTSSLLPNSEIKEIMIDVFQEDYLRFTYMNQEYIYFIPIPLEIYRIGKDSWHPMSEEIWINDIQQDTVLELYGMQYDAIQLRASSGELLEETIPLTKSGIVCKTRIGFLSSYKVSYEYTMLFLLKEGRVKTVIYCYNQCVLDEEQTQIAYNAKEKHTEITPVFYGKGQVYFAITNQNGEVVFRSQYLKKGVMEIVPKLASFTQFFITFYEKEKGLSLKKERVLKELQQTFYDVEDFAGKVFQIREIQFDQYVRGEFLRKYYYFNTTYLHLQERISDTEFVGELFAKTYKGTYTLDQVNPVEIEICGDVIDQTIEVAITKDGDGLLLDFEHRGVRNDLDDATAVDIFSYTVNLNGVKSFA